MTRKTEAKKPAAAGVSQMGITEFKDRVWAPLLESKLASHQLYTKIYDRYLSDFFQNRDWTGFGAGELRAFAKKLLDSGLAAGTSNRVLSVLKHFLRSAHECGLLKRDVSACLKAFFKRDLGKREAFLEAEELRALFSALRDSPKSASRAIELLILTGASKSEILSARWENYDSAAEVLAVKNRAGRIRLLRLGPGSVRILDTLPKSSPWIFPGRDGKSHISDVFLDWNEIRKACGLDGVRIQDLKHNHVNWQKNNAGSSELIERQMPR